MSGAFGALSAGDVLFLKTKHADAHSAVRAEVRQLSQGAWTHKLNPDKWCAAEIIEHIVLVEGAMLSRIRHHVQDVPSAPITAAQSDAIQRRLMSLVPKHGTVTAPAAMCQFTGIGSDAALAQLSLSHIAFSAFVDGHAHLPLKAIAWEHSLFGPLTAFHWLLYLSLHTLRHAGQMARINVNSNI